MGTTQGGHVMICARYARLSKKGRRLDDKAASIERQLQDAERFTVAHALGAVTGSTVYAEPEGTAGAAYGKRKDGVSHRPAWDRPGTTTATPREPRILPATRGSHLNRTDEGRPVMICARYARLSKKGKRNEDKAASIERQLGDAERFVLEHNLGGVVESAVYAEPEGTSGAAYGKRRDGVSRRPAWDAMMADAQAKKFKSVVMMTPDRGSREMFRGGAAFFDLFETGCAIYFYDRGPEPLDLSDPTKKLMFQIELFGGEFYRSSGKFKTTRAMQDLARNGFSTGIRIYGYRTVPTTTDPKKKLARYAIVPAQAEVVRRAFEQAAAGIGDLRIAIALNKDHIPGPRGTWSKEIIRNLLRSPIYKGLLIHGRTKNVDKGGDVSGHVAVPEDAWIKTPMPELAIVSTELWDQVRARKAATRARYMRAPDGMLLG